MKIKYFLIWTLIIGLLALVVFRIFSNREKSDTSKNNSQSQKPITNVKGIVVIPQQFANELQLSGSIEANEQVELRSEVAGMVQTIYFLEGQQVAKGQPLVKINDLELRAQLSQAKSKQTLAAENARRAKLLLEKEAISQEEFDVATAELQTAQAQTQLIQAQLAKTTIVAPFSGKIGLRSISPGTYVSSAQVIALLVNTNQVKITFSVPEKYTQLIRQQAPISFSTANSKDLFVGKIYAIEPLVEQATRTMRIRAIADNKTGHLIPGTYATILLPLEATNEAILIPNEAIIPIQNGKKVFISDKGVAKEVIIETANRTEKEILVVSGLKIGDTVITSGIMAIKNGAPLKVNVSKN